MRLGQAVADHVALPSDEEIVLCIVPLTEADYRNVLELIAELPYRDDLAGAALKDRAQSCEILVRAIREPDDLTERVYDDVNSMLADLQVADVDELIDRYNEMSEKSSPSLDGIPEAEFELLKKVLQEMDWNALSGSAWYAAKRFLSKISPTLQQASLLGSTSTNSLTTTND